MRLRISEKVVGSKLDKFDKDVILLLELDGTHNHAMVDHMIQ